MKTRLLRSFLFFFLPLLLSASLTYGQTAASVTWNLFGADSLSPTTTVGNITGQAVTHGDTLAIKDMTGGAPNSPIPGVTKAMRWYPAINGTAVKWGGTDTLENPNRWIQFTAAPKSGNAFIVDSISIYLGASGTTDHIRANMYYSTDPTFATRTLINPADTGVVPYRDSLSHYGYGVNILVNKGQSLYFRIYPWYDATSTSTSKYINTQYAQIFGKTVQPTLIADAKKMVNDTVLISGIVISPNFQTSNRSYYIYDGTAGIDLFSSGLTSPDLQLGDSVVAVGQVIDYYGNLEINTFSNADIVVAGTNAVLPKPKLLTINEFISNGGNYQAELISFSKLSKVSGSWPTTKKNVTLKFTDGTDTLTVYLDSDMGLYNNPEPTWPADMEGIGALYSSSGKITYELYPRYIADFMPAGSLPVELSSFTAAVNQKSVTLKWQTATETNNSGFDVERSSDGVSFSKVAFVKGSGSSTEYRSYSFIDENLKPGSYSYRLKQIDYNGKFEYSNVVEAQVLSAPTTFTLSQNYPNPFNPATIIKFSVEKAGLVTLKVYNILGQEVSTLYNGIAASGQIYSINFDASKLSSGIYFYQLSQGNQTKIQKMMLMK